MTWDDAENHLAEWDTHLFELRMDDFGIYIARAFESDRDGDHFQQPWGRGEMTAAVGGTPTEALSNLIERCRPLVMCDA